MTSGIETMVLTPEEMAAADTEAARSGIISFDLMERAGQAVAAAALRRFPHAYRFAVLCGPGNNGGDGYVAARTLMEAGATVAVFHLSDPAKLKGDAKRAFDLCPKVGSELRAYEPRFGDVVIDALFGAGLTRTLTEDVIQMIRRVEAANLPVIAIDLPSGLCGRRGKPLGGAFQAELTVTFMSWKPGHLLMPGRSLCGDTEVFDIGIPRRILKSVAGKIGENRPEFWREHLPRPDPSSHKYRRGHLAVFSGEGSRTGAARLSAAAGLRNGAGLVTVASPSDAITVNASSLTTVMLHEVETVADLNDWLNSAKLSAFVLGPGFGIGEKARQFVLAVKDRPLVLDADGITSFKNDPSQLFEAFAAGETRLVLTPHEGEFARLFPDLAEDENLSKVERAVKAAERAHAAIVYKGADTVIAAPDGRAAINTNAPPWLATAGSGDVLAGMIGALLAQGMPGFESAAAAVYQHGEAARQAGRGMTAEDLVAHVGQLSL
ncbi:bifunctional ADP-dependent NAD(P)H-hydrate dehydratase/NAD(P)H-hydrate epimerase [Rhizobium sp. LCM 4573]|uniref:bifunctional ADP-dependent NAD(P)H-hydrate dehydratase/NAD(P)H-hydrate epimerase n=1 Tax=Rhizobium sp. LCM 4573 TaxID=1848291 RepID=UPI0008DA0787|nr:bifunctional ADP-dependent NAD(P)H-hydrate dehydratase/NAD(P)H-hydrate epimerase [Rhizobium sp. LCM 4573]OHV81203.1 bifunctional ADP-dependent (S)-NAD(P)H-hydrate dehydratase/NAD(P)H-hydrate epimerase [Rhizobium sp. LCM 4573]